MQYNCSNIWHNWNVTTKTLQAICRHKYPLRLSANFSFLLWMKAAMRHFSTRTTFTIAKVATAAIQTFTESATRHGKSHMTFFFSNDAIKKSLIGSIVAGVEHIYPMRFGQFVVDRISERFKLWSCEERNKNYNIFLKNFVRGKLLKEYSFE